MQLKAQNNIKNFDVSENYNLEQDTILYMLEMSNYLDTTFLNRYEPTILEYEKKDSIYGFTKGSVLFMGSSSIRKWYSLNKDLAPIPIINRGFGGSTLPEAIYYFNRIALPYEPSTIVLYEGDNDITATFLTPDITLKMFKLFVRLSERYLPDTKIYFLSIKPSPARVKFTDKMLITNMLIKEECAKNINLEYINITDTMYDYDGEINANLFAKDMLHMNKEGYKIWTKIIKEFLLNNGF